MIINEKQSLQIERIGVTLEKSDFPPLAARIMALLLVAEPPYCTFDEITDNLKSSKSSVSTSLNLLLRAGLVDYRTFPGDRKRYFQVNSKTWMEMIKRKVEQISPFRSILEELTQTRSAAYPDFNQMLAEMDEFYAEMEEAMKVVMDRWVKTKK
ncbi:MAG: MarR family transcriptional regulator [Anditalea sp.]